MEVLARVIPHLSESDKEQLYHQFPWSVSLALCEVWAYLPVKQNVAASLVPMHKLKFGGTCLDALQRTLVLPEGGHIGLVRMCMQGLRRCFADAFSAEGNFSGADQLASEAIATCTQLLASTWQHCDEIMAQTILLLSSLVAYASAQQLSQMLSALDALNMSGMGGAGLFSLAQILRVCGFCTSLTDPQKICLTSLSAALLPLSTSCRMLSTETLCALRDFAAHTNQAHLVQHMVPEAHRASFATLARGLAYPLPTGAAIGFAQKHAQYWQERMKRRRSLDDATVCSNKRLKLTHDRLASVGSDWVAVVRQVQQVLTALEHARGSPSAEALPLLQALYVQTAKLLSSRPS